jgi:hypothetical protein
MNPTQQLTLTRPTEHPQGIVSSVQAQMALPSSIIRTVALKAVSRQDRSDFLREPMVGTRV